MTDAELCRYCGVPEGTENLRSKLGAKKVAAIEAMAQFEMEWNLYVAGLGPRPTNAIVCKC